jgi:hypothetical protein
MTAVNGDPLWDLRITCHLVPEIVGIEQIQHALLAAAEQQIPGQQREPRSAQVIVVLAEKLLIAGGKVVQERKPRTADAEFQQ